MGTTVNLYRRRRQGKGKAKTVWKVLEDIGAGKLLADEQGRLIVFNK